MRTYASSDSAALVWNAAGFAHGQVNEVSDMKVQVHGASAIVIVSKAFDGTERFADTCVKMSDGTWQCVASAGVTLK